MAGCDTSTNGVENTHRPSFGSEGALRGLGSNPAAEELPSGRLGGADVKIPTYIVSRAVEGVHAPLLVCPECGPAEAHPLLHFGRTSNELYMDSDHHPGGD